MTLTTEIPPVAVRPAQPSKRLYIIGGPIHQLQREFRMRGFQSTAPGIHIFAGEDVVDVSHYESGPHVRWAAFGQISVEMLDNMTATFGDRMKLPEAMAWFGVTI